MDGLPAAQLPQARVCHLAHGRLRLKIPEKRRDEAFFEAVRQQLSRDGIKRVEVNPLTASVLVQFSGSGSAIRREGAEQRSVRGRFRRTCSRGGAAARSD